MSEDVLWFIPAFILLVGVVGVVIRQRRKDRKAGGKSGND